MLLVRADGGFFNIACHFLTVPHAHCLPVIYYYEHDNLSRTVISLKKRCDYDKEQTEPTKHFILEEVKQSTVTFRQKSNSYI